jgi:hypothetical protein
LKRRCYAVMVVVVVAELVLMGWVVDGEMRRVRVMDDG